MFDLFRSRDKAVRWFLGIILGVIAFSMVITLVPGFGSTSSSAPEPVLAKVGDEKITTKDVQIQLQQMTRNRALPPEMIAMYLPQLIDSLISDRAMAYEAARMGFHVSDAEAANAIRSIMAPLFPNGEVDRNVYERYLADQGMTIPEFEANVKKSILVARLRGIPLEGVVITPEEVQQEFHRRNDKIKIEYAVIDPEKFKSEAKVTDEDVHNYFNQNRTAYRTPEKRTIDLLVGDQAKMAANVDVPEAQLRVAYNQNINNYRVPDRVKIRHILIKTMDKPKDEQAKAEAKANDLLKQLKGGADFATLAKANSEDPGSAQNGGDLGWVTHGQMVKPFEDAAFGLQPGQLSGIVKTEYGYHILKSEGKETGHVKPFEEVKADIANELKKQVVIDKLQQSMDQARMELAKNPNDAQQIANKYNLQYVHAPDVAPGAPLPVVGSNQQLETAIAGLKTGEPSQVFQLTQDQLGVAVISKITPSRLSEFDEAKDAVRNHLIEQQAAVLAQQKLAESVTRLVTSGPNFDSVAKSLGLDVKTTDFFTRDGAAEGIGPASALQDAFNKPVGGTFGPVNVTTKTYFGRVLDRQVADNSGLAAVRDDIQLALKRKKAAERRELFEDGVVTRLLKEGKIKKYDENIRKLEQSYHS